MKTLRMPSPRNATLTLATLMSLGGAAVLSQPASAEPHHDFVRVTVATAPVCATPVFATPVFAAPVFAAPVFAAPVFDARVIVRDRRDVRFDDWRVAGDRHDVAVVRFDGFDHARPGFDHRDR